MWRTVVGVVGVIFFGLSMTTQAEPNGAVKFADGQARRLTVRGKALDHKGAVVAGAKVFVIPANRSSHEIIVETATNVDGEFEFRDVSLPLDPYPILRSPDAKLKEGAFQVFAVADGYGLTWHPKVRFTLDSRPKEESEKDLIYAGEEARADLAFDLPAWLSGLVTNEMGQPLAGVKVQVGYCDDPRRPGGYGISSCSYLGPEADDVLGERNRFDGIRHLPEKYRMTVTDERGRYRLTQLRRDAQYLILLDAGPESDPVMFTGFMSTKETRGRRTLGYEGEVNETFKTPWPLLVQVISADGQPQPRVTIRARRDRILRSGGLATTDAAGRATLKLVADKYTLFLEPPYGSPHVLTEKEVMVSSETAGMVHSLTLDPAAKLLIKVVEEVTDKPIGGVSFVEEIDSGKRRRELCSQTVFVDHPVTDERGELSVIVFPGERRILVAKNPVGYEPVSRASELLKLAANSSGTTTFTFRKSAVSIPLEPEDEGEIGKLNAMILRQRELTKTGRFEFKTHIRTASGLSGDDLRSVLEANNPQGIPDLLALLRKKNPTIEIPWANMVVVVDGERARNESETPLPQLGVRTRQITAFNGLETVSYSSINAQADVYARGSGGFQIGMTDSRELTSWQPLYKIKGIPAENKPERKLSREGDRIIVELTHKNYTYREVFDAKTGFLYHQAHLHNGGESGRERWQFAPRSAPNGGIVAGMILEANYQKGQVGLWRIHELNSYSLAPPPPDVFAVSVPAGTNILDYRGKQRGPAMQVVSEPVTDVVSRANQISANAGPIHDVLKDGDPAPVIEPAVWLNGEGKTEKLDWKGKVLLVDFWGTGCGPCIAELPSVQAFAVKFQKAGGAVLGLHDSGGELSEVSEFVRKRSLTYQFAIDKPAANGPSFGSTFQAYGIHGIPGCVVINREGKVDYVGRFEEGAERALKLLEPKVQRK